MSLPLKKDNIYLEEEEESTIFEVSSANNYNMLLIDYIELYNFTRLYHKNSINIIKIASKILIKNMFN